MDPVTFNLNNGKTGKDGSKEYKLDIPTCHVTIISPSFGSPGVFEPGKPITLYILADKNFHDVNNADKKSLAEEVINFHLKITPWNAPKELKDVLLYDKGAAESNITCTFLKDLRAKRISMGRGESKNIPPETRIHNKEGKLVACIRQSTRDYYINPDANSNGVIRPVRPYLFQIDLNPDNMNLSIEIDKFYDCSWFVSQTGSQHTEQLFCELQDLDIREFVTEKSKTYKPKFTFKVNDGKVEYEDDTASPIQAYHPFIVKKEPHLNFGQLSDIHISSRQSAFRNSKVRVLEGMDDKTSPTVGEMVNVCLDSFNDMLQQLADDMVIDAIILTGDLVDYNRNFLPTTPIKNAGELWDMMLNEHHNNDKLYPPYLDSLVMLSLLKSYYDKPGWNKPIFIISGNHEQYEAIYGISPRLGAKKGGTGLIRANAGVPADHNLTIYEACLMYGPDYKWFEKFFNFKPESADWFYRIFTPLTDYRISFKKQSIAALGWGDGEAILNVSLNSFDPTLYRADKSVTSIQLELVNAAAETGEQRMLCTHFPLASYQIKHRLLAEGKINCSSGFFKEFDDFAQGSFYKNRDSVYRLLSDTKFQYTLSGHSHRAGLYQGTFSDSTYTVNGCEIPLNSNANSQVNAYGNPLLDTQRCNMIVSGSSGPVGIQNHYAYADEGLGAYGLDFPAGNHITLTPGGEELKRVIPLNTPSAKPRFAVALDNMDLLGREVDVLFKNVGAIIGKHNPGVFEPIISDEAGSSFTFKMNAKLPKERFIEKIEIMAFMEGGFKVFALDVEDKGERVLVARMPSTAKRVISHQLVPSTHTPVPANSFLSITFKNVLADKLGYKQYNYDSPWIYPIEVIDRKAALEKKLRNSPGMEWQEIEQAVAQVKGYELRRHHKHGEIPDFGWYTLKFKSQYQFDKEI